MSEPVATTAHPPGAPDDRRGLRWWKEALIAAGVYAVYSFVRNQFGSASGDPGPAFGHALDIIDIEEALHLYIEPGLQQWYLDLPADGLIRLWNVYYGVAHFLVTFVALVWMYRRDPGRHRLLRNTLCITTCLAVVGFASFSLMPPRLLDDPGTYGGCQVYAPEAVVGWVPGDPTPAACDEFGFVDTVAVYGGWISFGDDAYEEVSNQYAAMPSMHIGWATWTAIVLLPLVRRRGARALVIAYPVLTLICILLTANHFWLDGVGGLACLGLGYLAARVVTRNPAPSPAPDATEAPTT